MVELLGMLGNLPGLLDGFFASPFPGEPLVLEVALDAWGLVGVRE